MKSHIENGIHFLYYTGNRIVRIVGGIIFLYLTWYSFRYTHYMEPVSFEVAICVKDSELWNVVGIITILGVFSVLSLLEKHTSRKVHVVLRWSSLVIAILWIGMTSFWWIFSADRVPRGDQALVCEGASCFIEGNYTHLATKASYCGLYPFQLGLISLLEVLFRVAGTYNYYAFEYLCAISAMGIVYLGYRFISELTDRMATVVIYNLLIMGCLPLIFYTPWVYGDIPSIFFALLTAWMILLYCKKGKKRYLALAVCALVFAMLVRKHTLLLIVAFGITAVLYSLKRKDRNIVIAFLLAVVLSYGTYQGIYKMYEIRSGYEHYDGLPIISWIAMGMQESNGSYGWYNNYPREVAAEQDYDNERIFEVSCEDLQGRLQHFKENPDYAKLFLKEKILSQWNEPLYQSIYFNTIYWEELGPAEGSLAAGLSGDYFFNVLFVSDRLHFIVFFGMLCYFLFAVKKDSNLLQHVLAVTIIGAFMYSIIHEAKSRYIFPYYVMMFPYAAYGIEQIIVTGSVIFCKISRRIGFRCAAGIGGR